jgi:hypothetical protein
MMRLWEDCLGDATVFRGQILNEERVFHHKADTCFSTVVAALRQQLAEPSRGYRNGPHAHGGDDQPRGPAKSITNVCAMGQLSIFKAFSMGLGSTSAVLQIARFSLTASASHLIVR